jgi:small subunit ribosomal protein S9
VKLQKILEEVVFSEVVVAAEEVVQSGEPTVMRERKVDEYGRAYATGKRKNSIARVWIRPGSGQVLVNGRNYEQYFSRPVLRMVMCQPFSAASREGQYNVFCTVRGGVLSGHRPERFVTASVRLSFFLSLICTRL